MEIIESGHVYRMIWLDGEPKDVFDEEEGVAHNQADLIFVNREDNRHPGTQTQEVIRALIDRTRHCDNCLRWEGNDLIIYHLRMALVLHEARALGRKVEKGLIEPELMALGPDGHFLLIQADGDAITGTKEFIGPGHWTAPKED